jgi:hypothetical protein
VRGKSSQMYLSSPISVDNVDIAILQQPLFAIAK